ncbi:dickkopf-related protein 3-like [Eleginops maclovinus]|uniref:dickkopf-related protein 3-like n=1 Tax=Eleginops maclovinus TaxID=56733 RepID=UPI003080B58F
MVDGISIRNSVCPVAFTIKQKCELSNGHHEVILTFSNVIQACVLEKSHKSLCYGLRGSPCTKDEECCSDQMCVWGQCTVNATSGAEGTICQGQSDCMPDLCCAFQRELLFPVCNPKPEKGESCWSHPNLLVDMLAWDQEGPRDHCPCALNLQCQPQGRGSVCGE